MITIKPLICKLTDFGESRSKDIHTQQILKSKTTRVNRGKCNVYYILYIRVLTGNMSAQHHEVNVGFFSTCISKGVYRIYSIERRPRISAAFEIQFF